MHLSKLITITIYVALINAACAQEFKDTLTKEVSFKSQSKDNFLVVNNVYGSVNIEAYNGNTVKIVGHKLIDGSNSRALEQGKQEIDMKVVDKGNTIYVFLDSPHTVFNEVTGDFSHQENNGWRRKYKYSLDINIKVPANTNLEVQAINNGDIMVKNVQAKEISVNNINGGITLDNISGQTYANALNRDINISYTSNPTAKSTYHSLNGDINILVKEDLNADVSFKSMNGDFYTNLETSAINTASDLKKTKGKQGIKYKLGGKKNFRIGKGGAQLDFKLLNGDVTVKSNL